MVDIETKRRDYRTKIEEKCKQYIGSNKEMPRFKPDYDTPEGKKKADDFGLEGLLEKKEYAYKYEQADTKCGKNLYNERKFDPPTKDGANLLRVMHWNILADGLSGSQIKIDKAIVKSLEKEFKVPKECLVWDFRRYLILDEIAYFNPDVITLVELDAPIDGETVHVDFMKDMSAMGYAHLYNEKKAKFAPHGTGIFWKKSQFIARDHLKFAFRPSLGGQVMTVAVLQQREDDQIFAIVGLHLQSDKDQKGEFQRTAQIIDALLKLEKLPVYDEHGMKTDTKFDKQYPVIINGDFNAELKVLGEGKEKIFPVAAKIPEWFHFKSLYTKPMNWSSWKKRPFSEDQYTIDYMFGNDEVIPISCLGKPDDDLVPKMLFPNYQSGSDHLSLVCDVQIFPGSSEKPTGYTEFSFGVALAIIIFTTVYMFYLRPSVEEVPKNGRSVSSKTEEESEKSM